MMPPFMKWFMQYIFYHILVSWWDSGTVRGGCRLSAIGCRQDLSADWYLLPSAQMLHVPRFFAALRMTSGRRKGKSVTFAAQRHSYWRRKALYLASAAILYNYPGRKPSTHPGGVSRSRIEPLAPRGAAPAAPSTLAAKPRQPSGIQVSAAIDTQSVQYLKLRSASFFRRRHLESGVDSFFQFRHVGDDAHQASGVLEVD